MPRTCTPERCEVLRLRGRGAIPDVHGLRLVQVGTAALRSRQLYGDFIRSTDAAVAGNPRSSELGQAAEYHRPPPPPLVVAEGRAALAASPALARTYRTYAWVWPVNPGSPRLWQVDDLLAADGARADRARSAVLVRRRRSGRGAARRPAGRGRRREPAPARRRRGRRPSARLHGPRCAGMRRDLEGARRRLTWSGARRWQLALLGGVESTAVAVAGVLGGWLVGVVVAGVAARLAGAPVTDVLQQSVLSPRGLGLAAATAARRGCARVDHGLAAGSARARGLELLDLVAILALVVAGVALLGGVANEDQLASGQGSALSAAPASGSHRGGGRDPRREDLPRRRALVGGSPPRRRRGAARGRRARARAWRGRCDGRVPHHRIRARAARRGLSRDAEPRRPRAGRVPGPARRRRAREPPEPRARLRCRSAPAVREVAGDGRLRPSGPPRKRERRARRARQRRDRAGPRRRLDPRHRRVATGLGVREGPGDLASLVDPGHDVALRGPARSPTDASFSASPRASCRYAAIVRLEDGSFRRIELGDADPKRRRDARAQVPRDALLVRLQIVPPRRLIERGADAGNGFIESVRLSGPLAMQLRDWEGEGGVVSSRPPDGVEARVSLTPQRDAFLRARQATDDSPPSVLVTPRLAELAGGVGGIVPLQVAGETVPVQVAGVVERFPGSRGETVVGDRPELATAINTAAPGGARENELWLDVAPDRVGRRRRCARTTAVQDARHHRTRGGRGAGAAGSVGSRHAARADRQRARRARSRVARSRSGGAGRSPRRPRRALRPRGARIVPVVPPTRRPRTRREPLGRRSRGGHRDRASASSAS